MRLVPNGTIVVKKEWTSLCYQWRLLPRVISRPNVVQ